MLPEAAGLTHQLLLLQPQLLHYLLLMQQLQLDLQNTMFCIPSMYYLGCIYVYIQELVLWCPNLECIYFSLWWSSECRACSWMVIVSHLRDLMRSIVRLLLKPQTIANFCNCNLQWLYLQMYAEELLVTESDAVTAIPVIMPDYDSCNPLQYVSSTEQSEFFCQIQ